MSADYAWGTWMRLSFFYGDVAQLVAQVFCKDKVEGSSPFFSTIVTLTNNIDKKNLADLS